MANKGKRLIFCDEYAPKAQEGIALDAGILPGSLVDFAANGFNQNADAATVFGNQLLIADYAINSAGDVDTAWTQNESMVARALPADCRANVLVAAGNNILAVGTALSSNGDGTLKIALTNGTEKIIAYSDEIINVTGAAALVRVRGA